LKDVLYDAVIIQGPIIYRSDLPTLYSTINHHSIHIYISLFAILTNREPFSQVKRKNHQFRQESLDTNRVIAYQPILTIVQDVKGKLSPLSIHQA
jgi:hypothetical protein